MNIEASALAAAVRTVLPATKTGHLPVLKGVRLEGIGGCLHIAATDLDLSIETAEDCDGYLPPMVVPASVLAGWLEGAEGTVKLEDVDDGLRLSSDTGTMVLRSLPVEDYPKVERAYGEVVNVTDDERVKLLGITYAASRDNARPILNGVGIGDGWACCTDSYQLCAVKIGGLPEAIIPVRIIELALKNDGPMTMMVDDRRVTITNGATIYTGRLIEGRFPTWQALVGEPKTTVTLDRERTIAALERVLVLANSIETPVRISPEGDGLAFTVVARDVGEVVERVAGGDELGGTFGFRPRLLLAMLQARAEAKVELGVTDSLHPVSIRDDSSVALVMPVRLA